MRATSDFRNCLEPPLMKPTVKPGHDIAGRLVSSSQVKLPSILLHSASVPSEEEKVSVNRVIEDAKTTLLAIDDEVARLRSSLALLEVKRGEVEAHITTHQAVLSPIRRIPPEVLSEIFLFAAADSTMSWPRCVRHHDDIPLLLDSNEIPWRLGEVCSYWRTLLLSLPKLWSTIHLDLTTARLPPNVPVTELTRQVHKFLDTCLVRAGNGLITFTLQYRSSRLPEEDDGRELTCSILMALVGVSERWEDVKLDLADLFSFYALLSPARNRVPNLHTLHLESSGQSSTTPRPWHAIDAFVQAPQLTNLTLVHISQPTHHLRLPWGQLRSLRSKSSNFHEGEFTRILKQSPSLEEFWTEDERVLDMAVTANPALPNSNSPTTPNNAVHLPHLHSLSIVNKGSYISRIFQLITAPSLTNLSIHSRTAYSAEHTISMLRRSSCSLQLRTLTLESSRDLEVVWEENYGIVCLLAEARGVEECVLRVSKAADEIVPRLTVRRGMGGTPQRSPVISSMGSASIGMLGSGGYGCYGGMSMGQMTNNGMSGHGSVLLPNLRRFSLDDSFCESAGELKEMVQSRMVLGGSVGVQEGGGGDSGVPSAARIAQLSKVHLKLSRPAPPTYAELDVLKDIAKERGLDITLLA